MLKQTILTREYCWYKCIQHISSLEKATRPFLQVIENANEVYGVSSKSPFLDGSV